MLTPLSPKALVTVMTIEPFNRVRVETFEVDYATRPVWISKDSLYTNRLCSADGSIREVIKDLPVDVATWLHRAGLWDQLELDT